MKFVIEAQRAIAMVDDNPGDLVFAKTCFEKSKLTNPWLEFQSGSAFISYLERVKLGEGTLPALVLMDINMPQMSGHQVLERVRQDPFYREVPVFCMLTGSAESVDRKRASRLGADGFMVKPDSVRELIEFFNSLTTAG